MPAPTLAELETAVRASWTMWTADPSDHHRWSTDAPASGQCGSTALLVHDTLGGEMLEAEVWWADGTRHGWHYFNRLPDGRQVDLTHAQFRDGERLTEIHPVTVPVDRDLGRWAGPCHLLQARVARELARPGISATPRPVSVKGVCRDTDGKVLLCRNHRGEWELPGGRPEHGELFQDALARELAEETGRASEVGRLIGVAELEARPGQWVDLVGFALARPEPGERAALTVSAEHLDIAFHDPAELADGELPAAYRRLITAAR